MFKLCATPGLLFVISFPGALAFAQDAITIEPNKMEVQPGKTTGLFTAKQGGNPVSVTWTVSVANLGSLNGDNPAATMSYKAADFGSTKRRISDRQSARRERS